MPDRILQRKIPIEREILKDGVRSAQEKMNRNKAARSDGIVTEVHSASDKIQYRQDPRIIDESGHIPENLTKSIFLILAK